MDELEENPGQPLVGHVVPVGRGERIGVLVRNRTLGENPFAGFQVNPEVVGVFFKAMMLFSKMFIGLKK